MSNLLQSDIDIIEAFENNFYMLKNQPIILYGIGEKTKLLLDNMKDYRIVGLMDKNSTGSTVYGKKVLAADEIIGSSKNIIIVSNYASVDIIYSRIVHLEEEHGINIFHLNGTRPKKRKGAYGEDVFKGTLLTYNDLINSIKENDIISFDIFDTLLVRKCIVPTDIFHIVERKLSEIHGIQINFSEMRIAAERLTYSNKEKKFDINNIYETMKKEYKISNDRVALFLQIEVETEIEYIIPREVIIDVMKYAKELNKIVLLTSDMYLTNDIMKKILNANNIYSFDELNISCELNKTKYTGEMWKYYKTKYSNKKILHIGDDEYADIKVASNYDINTFKICSSNELLSISSIRELTEKTKTIDDRILLGRIMAFLFNNPFVLVYSNKLEVRDFFTAGYAFLGPLVLKFMIWLINVSKKKEISNLLFLSRDGYILQKLYQDFCRAFEEENLPKGLYFLTSRRALSVSSINNGEDIIKVCKLAPYVTKIDFGQFLFATFGINTDDSDTLRDCFLYNTNIDDVSKHIVDKYSLEIINKAANEKKAYIDNYKSKKFKDNEKIGVVNFVSSGITQHYFEKLFPNPNAIFLYFAIGSSFKDVKHDNEAYSLYGKGVSAYTSKDIALIKHYLTAEAIFSAPDEQFVCYSDIGEPTFENNANKKDFSGIAFCHNGIEHFFKEVIKGDINILNRDFSLELVDSILGYFFSPEICNLSIDIKKYLNIKDNFSPEKMVRTVNE